LPAARDAAAADQIVRRQRRGYKEEEPGGEVGDVQLRKAVVRLGCTVWWLRMA